MQTDIRQKRGNFRCYNLPIVKKLPYKFVFSHENSNLKICGDF